MRKRNRGGKKATIEKLAYAAGGSIACLMANGIIDKGVDAAGLDADKTAMVAKVVPVGKLALGGYYAMNTKSDNMRYAAIGWTGTAAVETAQQFAPGMFNISGSGSLFETIGSSGRVIKLQIDPNADTSVDDSNDIYGTGEEYAEAPAA